MRTFVKWNLVVLVVAAGLAFATGAYADTVIYQATTPNGDNGLNFGPDGTANPPPSGYWEMGNTITFAGSGSHTLSTVDLTLFGGGDVSYPIELQIYSGNNPNTGTLLGTFTAPAGYGVNTTVFNLGGLIVPDTVTYILSLPIRLEAMTRSSSTQS